MATALQICNSALIKLGAKTISALTGLTTKEYDLCVAQYPRLRNAVLRNHTWSFAKIVDDNLTTAAAAALTEVWSYRHTIPTTIPVARFLSFTSLDDIPVPYERVGAYLYSNEEDPRLRYVRSYTEVDDAATFPDDFGEAVAALLAAELSVSLTQNQSLRDTYLQQYQAAISQARFNGAIEDADVPTVSEDWIASHQGFLPGIDPRLRGLEGY